MRKAPPTAAGQLKRYQTAAETVLAIGQVFTYFKAMSPHRIVGVTSDAGNCPISNYLRETLGLEDSDQVEVDGDFAIIRQKNSHGEFNVEADVNLVVIGWPHYFTRTIDGTVRPGVKRDITAGEALTILKGAK